MGFWKSSPFLVLSILALYHMGVLQAAPSGSAPESRPNPVVGNEEELPLLLAAVLKEYVHMQAHEVHMEAHEVPQEQETEGSRVTVQKRFCNSATCAAHWLAGWLSRAGSVADTDLLPSSMVSKDKKPRPGRELKA